MSSRLIWSCVALVATVAIAAWIRVTHDAQPLPESSNSESARPMPSTSSVVSVDGFEAPQEVWQPLSRSSADGAAEPATLDEPETSGLQLDARGHLVKNVQTRDELERILNAEPAVIAARRQQILETLPPGAAQEALEVLERFTNYRAALLQAMPQTAQLLTAEDARVMLDTLHTLRVAYLGPQLTEAFFGAEEAIARGIDEQLLRSGAGAH